MLPVKTLLIIAISIGAGSLITALIFFLSARKMETNIYVIDNRIIIDEETEEKLELFYNDEFESIELEKDQRN